MNASPPDPSWPELLGGLLIIVLWPFSLALSIDSLGDLIKEEVANMLDHDVSDLALHSLSGSAVIIALCAALIILLLVLMQRFVEDLKAKWLERVALLSAILLAPVIGLSEIIAKWLEGVLS